VPGEARRRKLEIRQRDEEERGRREQFSNRIKMATMMIREEKGQSVGKTNTVRVERAGRQSRSPPGYHNSVSGSGRILARTSSIVGRGEGGKNSRRERAAGVTRGGGF
jgi:hypothetical protein